MPRRCGFDIVVNNQERVVARLEIVVVFEGSRQIDGGGGLEMLIVAHN